LSVPLQITVEIGRASRKIKDILDFSSGTIVELNKQAGSQVDIFVNGKAIAKGDVVVVDDYYGVRITEVSSNSEIIKAL
jgi:flagellar motor switch protein FliN/FliY